MILSQIYREYVVRYSVDRTNHNIHAQVIAIACLKHRILIRNIIISKEV